MISARTSTEKGNRNREIENIEQTQPGVRNTVTETKNALEGIGCGLEEAEGRVRDLGDKVAESTQQNSDEKK